MRSGKIPLLVRAFSSSSSSSKTGKFEDEDDDEEDLAAKYAS